MTLNINPNQYKSKNQERDHRQNMTDRIIKELNNGTLPWQTPWPKGLVKERPRNNVTGATYKGMNLVSLEVAGYGDPRWMTFKQAENNGFHVRKGAKAHRIEYWSMKEYKVMEKRVDPDNGEIIEFEVTKTRPIGRTSAVFNAEDIDGIPAYYNELTKNLPEKEINERAERLINATGANIMFDSPGEAFFDKHTQIIHLSPRYTYNSTYDMYASILHQLAHWTSSKMNRRNPDITEDKDGYMREELRVELACYFLAHDLGIGATQEHIKSHAAFIAPWVKMLKLNKNEIYRAAGEAEKIYNFLLSYLPEFKQEQRQNEEKQEKIAEAKEDIRQIEKLKQEAVITENLEEKSSNIQKEEEKHKNTLDPQDVFFDLAF